MEPAEFPGVFRSGRTFFTRNAEPGRRIYGETLRVEGDVEYRAWDPFRSKLAAYFVRGASPRLFDRIRSVLYLGGAHGTTVSHLAEVLPGAPIYVVEKSPRSFAPLLDLARRRTNLFPILADAQLPERYAADVGLVDFLYQDVAQRGQTQIFRDNAAACLRAGGRGLLMLKVRSVSQSRSARSVLGSARAELAEDRLTVGPVLDLSPFSRDHLALPISA